MGKTTSYPYANGNISINGQTKASTYKKGNTVYSDYYMSPTESKIYDFAQNSFLENLPNINVFSSDTQNDMRNQLNAYTNQGMNTIEKLYTPMISNLKTDIASRFGNFDNSIFLDKLDSIEDKRADSMSSLAQDILAKQNSLVNDELSKRYTYLNFLNDIQNQTNSNIFNYLNRAAGNSNTGTSYNSKNINNYSNLSSQMLGNVDISDITALAKTAMMFL